MSICTRKCCQPLACARSAQVKKKLPKTRGRRGFGGMWRAYVRTRSFGRRGRPDLGALGVDYKDGLASGSIDVDALAELGRAATAAGRACPPRAGSSAFGPTGRQVLRRRLSDLCHGLVATLGHADPGQEALELADKLSTLGVKLADAVTAARAAQRQTMARERQRKIAEEEALKKFKDGDGARAVADFRAKHPQLPDMVCIDPVPYPSGVCFEVRPASFDVVSKAVAWASTSQESNAAATMKKYWAAAHTTLPEPVAAPRNQAAQEPTPCQKAGRCICSPEGKALHALRASVLKAFKRACPPHSPERALLMSGDLVVHLRGEPAGDDFDTLLNLEEPFGEAFLQVGLMYLSPFRPTFAEVRQDMSLPAEEVAPQQMVVKAMCGRHAKMGGL